MAGRPLFEITEEILETVESYAARGLNQQQIADALGIHVATLCEKKNQHREFYEAIKRGKAKGIAHVANNLLKNVENANVSAQIFYLKVHAGWKETDILEHRGKDGDAIKVQSVIEEQAESKVKNFMAKLFKKEQNTNNMKDDDKDDDL